MSKPPTLVEMCIKQLNDEQKTYIYINRGIYNKIYRVLVEHEFWKHFITDCEPDITEQEMAVLDLLLENAQPGDQ